ncbi:hypothetical protein Lalb_Chr16g0387621 [Lupinus albus]|uniref:Uncharacterized protein n=1 Tax=Lupinus albus TaxID=3870 RepID=A0A6A4P6U8_LUPAL|nr:hypothetical protein Lalb_Chr16g0387621 [Lupinus albus]
MTTVKGGDGEGKAYTTCLGVHRWGKVMRRRWNRSALGIRCGLWVLDPLPPLFLFEQSPS